MTDLTGLSGADLLAALSSDDERQDDEFNEAVLRKAVGAELTRRLTDKEAVRDLPGTGLLQLAKELMKTAPAPEAVDVEVSILDRIDALPAEHATELIRRELARLDATRDAYFKKIEELQEAA